MGTTKVAHRRPRRHRSRSRREQGNAMLFALAFVLLISLLTIGLLSYGFANMANTRAVRQQRVDAYAADAALDAAINWVRASPGDPYRPGVDGLGRSAAYSGAPFNDPACIYTQPADPVTKAPKITVSCEGTTTSGLPLNPGDIPRQAILTTGQLNAQPGPRNDSIAIDNFLDNIIIRGILSLFGICQSDQDPGRTTGQWTELGIRYQAQQTFCGSVYHGREEAWNIGGDIRSNSVITTVGSPNNPGDPKLTPSGIAYARGSCTGLNIDAARLECDKGYDANALILDGANAFGDPRVQPPTDAPTGQWAHRPIVATPGVVPATCTNGLAKLEPGTYTSATAINTLFRDASCRNATIWFKPGVYYFNFTNGPAPNSTAFCGNQLNHQINFEQGWPGLGGQLANWLTGGIRTWNSASQVAHEWCVGPQEDQGGTRSEQKVVGGTPNTVNFNPDAIPMDPADPFKVPQQADPHGGNCDPTEPGVQFIFGGDSRVYVADGFFELCAGANATGGGVGASPWDQQVAVYGLPASPVYRPTSLSSNPGGRLSNPANGLRIGEPSGKADSRVNHACRGFLCFGSDDITVTASGFTGYAENGVQQSFSQPSGTDVSRATLRVAYDSCRSFICLISLNDPEWRLTVPGGKACSGFRELDGDADLDVVTLDVTDCVRNNANDLASIGSASFDLVLPCSTQCEIFAGGSADLIEGVDVQVSYASEPGSPAAEVPQGGCITALPNYWDGLGNPDCALLKSDQVGMTHPRVVGINPGAFSTCECRGFTSIKGTAYAPSAAFDLSDDEVRAPWFSRGLIARTLRIKSYACNPQFAAVCAAGLVQVPTQADPADDRNVDFTACVESTTDADSVCTSGPGSTDRILATANVGFNATPEQEPSINAWNNRR